MKNFLDQNVYELYEWYQNLENRISQVFEIVPFSGSKEISKFSTPRLVPILVEAASIIDSIFRNLFPDKTLRPNKKTITRKGANIFDFYRELENQLELAKTSSLVLTSPPIILRPFKDWNDTAPNKMSWWIAYNRLKHDRFKWGKEANLLYTLNAICGLQQLMTKVPIILKYALRFNWINLDGHNPTFVKREIEAPNKAEILVTTKYFCTSLKPIVWNTVEDVIPSNFRNGNYIMTFLGRY